MDLVVVRFTCIISGLMRFENLRLADATHTNDREWLTAMMTQSAFLLIYLGLVIAIYIPNRVTMISFFE